MSNPYSAPSATFTESDYADATYEPRIFALNGRIGRARYLAYGICLNVVFGLLGAALVGGLTALFGNLNKIVEALMYLLILAGSIIVARRRLHDLDRNGWLAVLVVVPLLNVLLFLYLLFARGTEGANEYGPPPSKSSSLMLIGAIVAPVILIGILAAIAIPAYQDYVKRAKLQQLDGKL